MTEQKSSCGCGCVPMHQMEQKSSCGCGCIPLKKKETKSTGSSKTAKKEKVESE